MSEQETPDRRDTWIPPKRPEWVQRINAEGRHMDIKSVVPLDEASLIDTAKTNTGLTDFGDDNWYEPFKVLIRAIEEESQLNLMGRLMTRSNLLIFLEARLRIEDTYKKHPEIDEEEIQSPLFIIGQGRSGTSELHKLLSRDPNSKSLLNWEVMFPCPPPEKATYFTDPRIERTTALQNQYFRVTPEYRAIYEDGGDVPCENVYMHCLSFRSPAWFNAHAGQVPSYLAYMQTQDTVLQFEYEKRVLKLLQWKNPTKQPVLKSPYALLEIPAVLKVYPDVKFIWTHRDPVKSLASTIDLLGTFAYVRSDVPFIGGSLKQFADPKLAAGMLNNMIDLLEQGTLPGKQLCNIQFLDFIADQMRTVETIYQYYGIEMTMKARLAMQKHIDSKSRSNRPEHKYDPGSPDRVQMERQAFKKYQDYFAVPNEV